MALISSEAEPSEAPDGQLSALAPMIALLTVCAALSLFAVASMVPQPSSATAPAATLSQDAPDAGSLMVKRSNARFYCLICEPTGS